MAEKGILRKDPWRELLKCKDNQQVELGEVMLGLSVNSRSAEALKRDLLSKVSRLTRRN